MPGLLSGFGRPQQNTCRALQSLVLCQLTVLFNCAYVFFVVFFTNIPISSKMNNEK